MELDTLIREAALLPRIGEDDYRSGVVGLIARIAPYNALESQDFLARAGEIGTLLTRHLTPFVVKRVTVYHDSGSDPEYIDVRTDIVTSHGDWQITRTHSMDGGERSDGDIMYSPDSNTAFDVAAKRPPNIVEEMFARYRHLADDLINIKLRERNGQ